MNLLLLFRICDAGKIQKKYKGYRRLFNIQDKLSGLSVSAWAGDRSNRVIKSVMEQEYSQKESYVLNYNNKTVEDKYRHVLSNEPRLVQRVTTQDLASYLGLPNDPLRGQKDKYTI